MTDFDDPCELERELLDIAERYEQFYDDALAAADENAMNMLENVPLQCQAVGVPKPSVFASPDSKLVFEGKFQDQNRLSKLVMVLYTGTKFR